MVGLRGMIAPVVATNAESVLTAFGRAAFVDLWSMATKDCDEGVLLGPSTRALEIISFDLIFKN